MSLKELKSKLCQSTSVYCKDCFAGTPFETKQNPPNVFRTTNFDVAPPIVFVFDKPNNNNENRFSPIVPITIYDDRAGIDPRLKRAPSHSTLISLCQLLDLVDKNSDNLDTPKIHITNAVKCDVCSETGRTGRVEIGKRQADICRKQFFEKEIKLLKAQGIVFFGVNAQRYVLGESTPLWKISQKTINNNKYFIMRVPHTSPQSYNTHGGRGTKYLKPFNELLNKLKERR